MKRWMIRLSLLLASAGGAARAAGGDWPTWGHDPSRNMVSAEKNLPADFNPGQAKAGGDATDPATVKGLRWAAKLGSQTFGNPAVAGGKVFVGTNNDSPRDPARTADAGILLCFDQATGKFLWQLFVPKLAAGSNSDYEHTGLCSPPTVEHTPDGDRVYLVTNRCEVLCLTADGLVKGNQGPFQDEGQYVAGPGSPPAALSPADADIIWRFDLRDEVGAIPRNMTSSSVLVVGDRLYVTTSNAVDWTEKHTPSPFAPALVCLDKRTGKLLGEERSGISARTYRSNWSTPALATAGGRAVIVFGGGDGFCYGFDPVPAPDAAGRPTLKERWRFDCNPPAHKTRNGKPLDYNSSDGPSEIISTPVFHDGKIYVAVGREPEATDGPGCLSCIDAAKALAAGGDVTESAKVWQFQKLGHSISTASVADGLAYLADYSGRIHCLDAATGGEVWVHDTEGTIWGSTLVADGKVYVGNGNGVLTVLAASREKKVLGQVQFEGKVYSTPVVADGVLFVASETTLYAFEGKGGAAKEVGK